MCSNVSLCDGVTVWLQINLVDFTQKLLKNCFTSNFFLCLSANSAYNIAKLRMWLSNIGHVMLENTKPANHKHTHTLCAILLAATHVNSTRVVIGP